MNSVHDKKMTFVRIMEGFYVAWQCFQCSPGTLRPALVCRHATASPHHQTSSKMHPGHLAGQRVSKS